MTTSLSINDEPEQDPSPFHCAAEARGRGALSALCSEIPTRSAHRMQAPETESMHMLTWHDFDRAVASIAERLHGRCFRGVHGLPRGGLVLAVSLSHRLELPQLLDPQPVTP